MRVFTRILIFFLLIIFLPLILQAHDSGCSAIQKNFNVNFHGDTLVLQAKGNKGQIMITDDYRLFVNGNEIALGREQQNLVRDYYLQLQDIVATALKLVPHGAEIGLQGAHLGLKAILHTILALDDDYDKEKVEKELKEEETKLEQKAKMLEKKGKSLEKMGDEFEDLQCRLFHQVKALQPFLGS